jgi:hypothetical protein
MTTHIASSPLTGRIYQGRISKTGLSFVGEKKDITSQVLGAVIEKAEFHGGSFYIEGAGQKWTVTITKETK